MKGTRRESARDVLGNTQSWEGLDFDAGLDQEFGDIESHSLLAVTREFAADDVN
jgi:hypothetical protein